MHIPNHRVYKEIKGEPGGLWYTLANGGDDTAILIKAPSNTLKAIATGCKIELLFGEYIHEEIKLICTGVRIFDTSDAPLLLFSVQRHSEEHIAIKKIFETKHTPIFLFNEMDMCVASGVLNTSDKSAKKVISLLGELEYIYSGKFEDSFNLFLDDFHIAIDPTRKEKLELKINSISISVEASDWDSHIINFVGYGESEETILNTTDEGGYFENKVWFSLDSVFKTNLYKSPQVKLESKVRELIDILAFSDEKLFLIEAKSLSVIKAGFKRKQERKSKGIINQVDKAINQLVGAFKALDKHIFEKNKNTKILIPNKNTPHCIVLISELVEYGDWQEIEKKIIELTKKNQYYIHVIDLREWIDILKISSGNMYTLDASLKTRFNAFNEHQSIQLRVKKF